MLALLLESALRLLALGGVVWLGLKLFRVRNPHAQMTAWTVVLLASLSMPVLMRFVTVTIPAGPPPPQLARIVSAAPSLSSGGDTFFGGDTFSGRTGAICRSALVPGIGRYRFRFGRDIPCARLAGGDGRHLSRRRRCAVAPIAHRPRAHLASDPQSAASGGPLGRRRGRAGERCRRHAGDLRIDHSASARMLRVECRETPSRAVARRLARRSRRFLCAAAGRP